MKKILLFFALMAMIGCVNTESTKKEKVVENENLKEFYQDIQNTVDKLEDGIQLPEGLSVCDSKYFEKNEDSVFNCDSFPKEPVCSFYYLTKNGEKKLKSLQYSNECFACSFYGEDGLVESGDMKYEQIGMLKGACTQGIYQK